MKLDFSLQLNRGNFPIRLEGSFEDKITAVLGPSGAGKTSFLYLIAGILRPDQGKIVLNDRVLTETEKKISVPPEKRRMGFVFQEKLLFPHMSVKENLNFSSRYTKKSRKSKTGPDADTVIELLNLGRILYSKAGKISGGEKQRTAIGRALLSSPELLLLDEPFNAVDMKLRGSIVSYLERASELFNIPMLVVSHNLKDLRRLTDSVYLIDNGKCSGYDKISRLYPSPELYPQKMA